MGYHSEYSQDAFVHSLLPKRNGIFVEFGALDGLLHSNSLFFERERDWRGLLIEANPFVYHKLSQNRPLAQTRCAAVFDRMGEIDFEVVRGGLLGWSGIVSQIEDEHWKRISQNVRPEDHAPFRVPCVTLDYALKSAGITEIDYLSIDTEGSEQAILSVFPWADYRIHILQVENNFWNAALDEMIRAAGFRFIRRIGPDFLYCPESGS